MKKIYRFVFSLGWHSNRRFYPNQQKHCRKYSREYKTTLKFSKLKVSWDSQMFSNLSIAWYLQVILSHFLRSVIKIHLLWGARAVRNNGDFLICRLLQKISIRIFLWSGEGVESCSRNYVLFCFARLCFFSEHYWFWNGYLKPHTRNKLILLYKINILKATGMEYCFLSIFHIYSGLKLSVSSLMQLFYKDRFKEKTWNIPMLFE